MQVLVDGDDFSDSPCAPADSGASAVSACKHTLVDLKYIVGDKIVRVDPEHSPVTGAILDKVPANSVPEALVPVADRPAPVLGWTWRFTQVAVLRQAISDVEPTICSHANLRVLAKKHAKEPPLAPVLEIWEFLFGLDPDVAPPPFHDYTEFLDFLKDRKDACGDRAMLLRLPMNWSDFGVYGHDIVDQTIKVSHCVLGLDVHFPIPSGAPADLKVFISSNFSERRAVLHDSTGEFVNEVCHPLFFKAGQQNVTPKKRRIGTLDQLALTTSPERSVVEADGVGLGGGGHVSPGATSRAGKVETVEAGGDGVGGQSGQVSTGLAAGSTVKSEVADSEANFVPPPPPSVASSACDAT